MTTMFQSSADVHPHRPGAVPVLAAVVAAIGLSAAVPCAAAQYGDPAAIDKEYKLKAVFLYKFATYIRWPVTAFAGPESPFVIGVLGPDPVGPGLRKIAAVKEIGGRKIEVRNFTEAKEVRRCQILFISRAVDGETQAGAIRHLSGRSVLLVGESRQFLQDGGVINFSIQENRVHIYTSKSAYRREGLDISAHLLRIATVMD